MGVELNGKNITWLLNRNFPMVQYTIPQHVQCNYRLLVVNMVSVNKILYCQNGVF